MTEKWGYGNPKNIKPFDTIKVDQREFDLLIGEYPHSTNDNNFYARDPYDGEICDFNGHRVLYDIKVESKNYIKHSYGTSEIRKSVYTSIIADGEQIYEFNHRDPLEALLRARELLLQLMEHPSEVVTKDGRARLVGRKIYYREIPAVITRVILDQGEIIVEPKQGFTFPPPVYAYEYEDEHDFDEDDEEDLSVKVDILTPNIWWFREK
jgi:hypothetical protein